MEGIVAHIYVFTGIWLHMCKCIVEYRWGTGWELILKLMDGMIKFVEVP